jgi:hypothetical protein
MDELYPTRNAAFERLAITFVFPSTAIGSATSTRAALAVDTFETLEDHWKTDFKRSISRADSTQLRSGRRRASPQ